MELLKNLSFIITLVIFSIYILDINLEALSNNTYNSFVKYIISQQLEIKTNRDAGI